MVGSTLFGNSEGEDCLAPGDFRQVFLLLLIGSIFHDGNAAEDDRRKIGAGQTGFTDFLEDHCKVEKTHLAPAICLRDNQPRPAELHHLLP